MQSTQGHDLHHTCGYVFILSTLGMQATHGLWRGLVMLIQRPFVPTAYMVQHLRESLLYPTSIDKRECENLRPENTPSR